MPNVVRGSKQQRMTVVPHRPWRRAMVFLATGVLLVTGLGAGLWFGYNNASIQMRDAQSERQRLISELATAEAENADLRGQVAVIDRTRVLDQQANDEIQATIIALREQVTQLEQDVQFYRQVMADDFDDVGLVIGEVAIKGTGVSNRYSYRVELRQEESGGGRSLEGHANITLTGIQNDLAVEIPLKDVSLNEEQLDIKLNFKYFQNIEGELELPEGFIPEQFHVTAVATAPMAKTISESYDWVVEGG